MARKSKAADLKIEVPQNATEANHFIAAIGAAQRDLARIEADTNDGIERLKKAAVELSQPDAARIDALTKGLQIWAAANRKALTQDGKTKTVSLPAGELSWRRRPPKVTLKKVDAVLAELEARGLSQFVRTKSEVNKEAMLDDPETARTVPGVSIGSAGEDFIVKPASTSLEVAIDE
jgi:phage host-nuclease inhibitor protein Gam